MNINEATEVKIFAAMKAVVAVEEPLVVLCGWCPDARERTRAAVAMGKTVSHGMCPSCSERMMASIA